MAREMFKRPRQDNLSLSARTEPALSIVKRFKTYCRDQKLSVNRALMEVVEAFLDERSY